jgi:hypothetical protein
MSDQEKNQRLLEEGRQRNDVVTASDDLLASFGALSVDVVADIFGFLPLYEIMVPDVSTKNRGRQRR